MKTLHLLAGFLALMLLGTPELVVAQAQPKIGEVPIEITSQSTRVSSLGIWIAENNVAIHYETTSIYADYAEYDRRTEDLLLIGNVRIYRDGHLFTGDRVLYNRETKLLRAADFRGDAFPVFFQSQAISSLEGNNAFEAHDALITTDDSSKTDYSFRATTVRIYPGDRIILSDATLYLGQTPVMWFPYYYQSLKRDQGFSFIPGYDSPWGAYVLLRDAFPITDSIHGIAHFDLRSKRGVAGGADALGDYGPTYGPGETSWVRFKGYEAYDTNTTINPTAQTQGPIDSERYRVSLQDRTYFSEDIYGSVDINKLSDYIVLRDFYPAEYSNNPQPDNVVSLTKWDEDFTLTAIARAQLNDFFATTERLPEVALDVKRQPVFNTPVFYEGETSIARLSRDYGSSLNPENLTASTDSPFTDYHTTRFDTFHQLSLPETLFGWLNLVPVVGVRGTYYDNRAISSGATIDEGLQPGFLALNQNAVALVQKASSESLFRPVFNTGMDSSFKLSQEWENIQSRDWGLDGLRHIIQPYSDISYVRTNTNPLDVLQFDGLNPSTQLPPLDFPQYNSIDSIPNWGILRLGVRNTLQTRRDDKTVNWLTMDSYFNYNIDPPDYPNLTPPPPPTTTSITTPVRFVTASGTTIGTTTTTTTTTPTNTATTTTTTTTTTTRTITTTGTTPAVTTTLPPKVTTRPPAKTPAQNSFSNVFNRLVWAPVPWGSFSLDSQLPVLNSGFTQIVPGFNFLVSPDCRISISHQYLSGNPYYSNEDTVRFGLYYRLDDNWAFDLTEQYEFVNGPGLQYQQYEIQRSLSSWVASLGFVFTKNYNGSNGATVTDTGVVLTFTLKDLPSVTTPVSFNPSSTLP